MKNIRHKFVTFGFFCVVVLSFPLLHQLLQRYKDESSTSTIYVENRMRPPRVLLMMSWLSEPRMMELLKPPESFINEEKSRLDQKNFSLPFLCNFVQGLMLGNPILDRFDSGIDSFAEHIEKLKGIVDHSEFVQENGIEQLLLNSTYATGNRVMSVVDEHGRPYDYTSAVRKLGIIFAYEILVNASDRTVFSSHGGGYRAIIPREMPSDHKCFRRAEAMGILFRENEEGVGYDIDHFPISKFPDYSFHISSQRIELRNKKIQQCYEHLSDGSFCLQDCLDELLPCNCKAIYYGESKVAKITNTSNMCHKLQPLMQHCQMIRGMIQKDKVAICNKKCHHVCKRTTYYGLATARKQENLTHQYIDIVLVGNAGNFHVFEFFSYDIISLACALGAVVSLFFGYSFLSLFHAASSIHGKVKNRLNCY